MPASESIRFRPRVTLSRQVIVVRLLLLLCGLAGTPAQATVALARQYHAPCSMCHTVFPQLNRFGKSFLDNGFRIPNSENSSPLAFHHNIPFSFSTRASLQYDPQADKKVTTVWDDLQLHGSGLLTRNDSFYLHHHIFENSRGGDIYEAWLQHSFDGKAHLNLRVGQFVQLLAFAPEIQRLNYGDYIVYKMQVGLDDFTFASRLTGVLLTGGALEDGVRYSVSFTQPHRVFDGGAEMGSASSPTLAFTSPVFANLFARVQYRRNHQQFGLFTDFGQTNLITDQGHFADHYARYGLDAEIACGKGRIYGLWIVGTNSDPVGTGARGSLNGGFAGVDYRFNPRILAYVHYDHAQTRSPLGGDQQQGPSLGVIGLVKPFLQVQAEYEHRQAADNLFVLSTRVGF